MFWLSTCGLQTFFIEKREDLFRPVEFLKMVFFIKLILGSREGDEGSRVDGDLLQQDLDDHQ